MEKWGEGRRSIIKVESNKTARSKCQLASYFALQEIETNEENKTQKNKIK